MKQKRHLLATRLLLSLLAVLTASTAWADSAFSGGSGTKTAPYQIASTTDLNQLATDVDGGNSYSGQYFVLTADITYTNDEVSNKPSYARRFHGDWDDDWDDEE